MKKLSGRAAMLAIVVAVAFPAVAAAETTTVPGHTGSRTDTDNNGFPDACVQVVGNYTDVWVDGATTCKLRVNYG